MASPVWQLMALTDENAKPKKNLVDAMLNLTV